jgi:flagellar hook assembly protein FlgD
MKRTVMAAMVIGSLFPATGSGALSATLENVIVYPNPFTVRATPTLTFDNLTASRRIRIYKMTGELVRDMETASPDGRATWNGTNSSGEAVAPGVYIYLVTGPGAQKTVGRIVVVR